MKAEIRKGGTAPFFHSIINHLESFETKASPDDRTIGGNMESEPQIRYVFWEALFRFIFTKNDSFYEIPISLGPFLNIYDFQAWRNEFLKGIKEKTLRMTTVKVKILKEERFSQTAEFLDEAEEYGFISVDCLTPEEEGRLFFSETIQEWMFMFNLPFE